MLTEALRPAQLDVVALDEHSWRVASVELGPAHRHCVLAYVEERKPGRLSVLMLAPRAGTRAECSTMAEAMHFIAESSWAG